MNRAVADQARMAPVATLYYGDEAALEGLTVALRNERIELRDAGELFEETNIAQLAAVLLLDASLIENFGESLRDLPASVVVVSVNDAVTAAAHSDRISLTLPAATAPRERLRTLRTAYQLAAARVSAERSEQELARTRNELRQLHGIGMALMSERDPEKLLQSILEQARTLTQSDAGNLYLVEKDEHGHERLRFTLAQNDTLPNIPLVQFTLPIDTASIAGYAAYKHQPLVLADAYAIPDNEPYTFNRSFDNRIGYRTRSMLVVPMLDHQDKVVGVVQLLNRKREPGARITNEASADEFVVPYGARELQLVQSLAGQAAVSIENSQLYGHIEHLFDGFVKAAVIAIDQRDPTTAGHSIRVATLTIDLAEAVERADSGPYRDVHFTRDQIREIRYAALLHDFGKVGVREEVLVKAKKLPPYLWERVDARFDLIRRTVEAEYHRKRADVMADRRDDPALLLRMEHEFHDQLAKLDRFNDAVRSANEPTVLPESVSSVLDDIATHTFTHVDGKAMPFLDKKELHFLKIPKGTLDEEERREIESHVEQTYQFLAQIPWTEGLQDLAMIAYGHHEKLNGQGYPRGVAGDDIPIQTRMMTIADIFDALTAADRPYKRAVSAEQAIGILQKEAKDGLVDQKLVNVLIEAELYKKVLEQDWRAM